MSFQKHFAPVKSVIKEDEAEEENLLVVKPLNGIENQKFHPIIKKMEEIDVSITPYQMTPLNAVTKPFINQLKSFNEYAEQQRNSEQSFVNVTSQKAQKKNVRAQKHAAAFGVNKSEDDQKLKGWKYDHGTHETIHEGASEDGRSEARVEIDSKDNDMKLLEVLFQKVTKSYKFDKVELVKKLLETDMKQDPN